MHRAFVWALAAALPLQAVAAEPPAYVTAAVSSPDRPPEDVARDAGRKPAALLEFAGVKPGDTVADVMPGKGYFTRLFSNTVGKGGHVFAIVPTSLLHVKPDAADAVKKLVQLPAFANTVVVETPIAVMVMPSAPDVAWTSDNYHDAYGFFGAERAAEMDRAIFHDLRKGGVFIVIDHAAAPGHGGADATTLHRIDPETVKAQVLAAGFKLAAESDLLRNPADPHTAKVFAPEIRGHTDQFIFKFVKP